MTRLALCLLLLIHGSSHGMCFAEAAQRYSIPEGLLRAIAKVESGGNGAAMNLSHRARTKTWDIGLMQINSSWLPRLAKLGIDEEKLKEPCQNLLVGAWILSHHLRESGADWNGVGSYNASCKTLTKQQCEATRYGYSWKVYHALMKQVKPSAEGVVDSSPTVVASREAAREPVRSIRTVEAAPRKLTQVVISQAAVKSRQPGGVAVDDDEITEELTN